MGAPRFMFFSTLAPATAALALLAACALADAPSAQAAPGGWPPAWNEPPAQAQDFTQPQFEPPSASHCHRASSTREVPGGGGSWNEGRLRRGGISADDRALAASEERAERPAEMAAKSVAPSAAPAPMQSAPAPRHEVVTAGMVDDNADFGEYLAYRQRNAGLPVRDRDIAERYLLEVTDAAGRPVHDAEVAVQRAGRAEPVMWARTDTAGRVWLHPRAFLAPGVDDAALGIAVRKGSAWSRATLVRGERAAVQVRLGQASVVQRPRLDLVFLIDATGSMGDEIEPVKQHIWNIANQIASGSPRPELRVGLVIYRDRSDAEPTRMVPLTGDLDRIGLAKILDLQLAARLAPGPRQIGQRDVLADGRTIGDRIGVGPATELVDQRLHPRDVAAVVGDQQRVQVGQRRDDAGLGLHQLERAFQILDRRVLRAQQQPHRAAATVGEAAADRPKKNEPIPYGTS